MFVLMMNLMVVVMELTAEERAGHGYELMVMHGLMRVSWRN